MLVGLFVVVALITYACTRSSSPDEGGGQATGATPSPTPEESSPSVSPSPSASASPSPSAGASEGAEDGAEGGAAGSGDGSGDAGDESGGGSEQGSGGSDEYAAPESPGDPCRPSDVVVTLKADKSDYDWNDKPKFKLTLVNTEDQTCTVDVGRKNMEMRVTSGDDRIFSTADCVKGSGSDKQQLERGVPFTKTFTWDRKRSWKECRENRDVNAQRPGTYVVRLHSDYDSQAEPQVFRLN